ncbi:MAG TPA: choice-of-anchor A family protein [Saprospiraceae bacterium]|nr:choice-of-anchor A family protein [Saprospiraceae bacterium]
MQQALSEIERVFQLMRLLFFNEFLMLINYSKKYKIAVLVVSACFFNPLYSQNPISGNQGFQLLSEGNFTFTGGAHVHGPMAVGGNLIINTPAMAEINMDATGSYVFPGDGSVTTGLLVKGGITWTNGAAKVLNNKYIHIGSSSGCLSGDNGNNSATQIYPTGTTYNNSKRIEGTIDQTPNPAVFQTVGFDFASLFSTYRATSDGLSACVNNVQLKDANGVNISGNNVTSPQNVQITSLATGVNHLDLTTASLNNITEFKFSGTGFPSSTKLLVISVPLTGNFVWNNSNMPGISGSSHGAYILWNFAGSATYNLTVNSASLVIGTIFAPNHNFIKTGTGDIDGNIIAKTMSLGLGEIHFYPFNGNVALCSTCANVTSAGSIGSDQSGCGSSLDPALLTEASAPSGGSGTLQYQWQISTDNSVWTDISGATSQTYNPPAINATRYYRRGVKRNGCSSYLYSGSVSAVLNAIPSAPNGTGAERCGTGSVTLSASGCTGGALYWYTASSGGTAVGSGSSFVTPSLSSSTTYYVECAVNGCTGPRTPVTAGIF